MSQKAGDNSSLIHVGGNLVVNNGLPREALVASLSAACKLAFEATLAQYSKDARQEVDSRLARFEDKFLQKMSGMESALEMLRDPKLQFVLGAATKCAAQTDKESDYDTLTELMAYRMSHPLDRKASLGVTKAIEIAHEIDEEALQFLTAIYVFRSIWLMRSGEVTLDDTLAKFDSIYGKIPIPNRGNRPDIIEHLCLLDAIRLDPINSFNKGRDCFRKGKISGYSCLGIQKSTKQFDEVLHMLEESEIPASILVDNDLCAGYVRLGISVRGEFSHIRLNKIEPDGRHGVPLLDKQKSTLAKIESMYERDEAKEKMLYARIDEMINNHTNILRAIEFWDQQKQCFAITSVGNALANVKSRMYESRIPGLKFHD